MQGAAGTASLTMLAPSTTTAMSIGSRSPRLYTAHKRVENTATLYTSHSTALTNAMPCAAA